MPNEMVKRVAEAISKHATPEQQARAAIAAMRTLTRDMLRAGVVTMEHSSRTGVYADANIEAAYQAMVDSALGHALKAQNPL